MSKNDYRLMLLLTSSFLHLIVIGPGTQVNSMARILFFGIVSGFELELGYFSLKELKEVKGPMGLPIERDLYYEPKSLRESMEWHKKQRGE